MHASVCTQQHVTLVVLYIVLTDLILDIHRDQLQQSVQAGT